MLRPAQQLIGSRLVAKSRKARVEQMLGARIVSVCSRLAKTPLSGKTLSARQRVVDSLGSDERLPQWIAEEAEKRGYSLSDDAVSRIIAIASRRRGGGYWKPKRQDLSVVMCHYNPARWETTPRLLYETCESVIEAGISPLVLQVTVPGQSPAAVPDGVRSVYFESGSVLFLKENLWNIACRMTTTPKVLFLDGDVLFTRRDLFDAVSESLDEKDVIQPYAIATWLDRDGKIELVREPSIQAIERGEQPLLGRYHPGFAWAMTREFFDRCGGFYERHPMGGGDAAFVFAMTPGVPKLPKSDSHAFAETQSYKSYREKMLSLKPAVGYIAGTVYHKWHGTRENRKYEERYKYMPRMVSGEYPLANREDGLLVWESREHSDLAFRYFVGRQEDG